VTCAAIKLTATDGHLRSSGWAPAGGGALGRWTAQWRTPRIKQTGRRVLRRERWTPTGPNVRPGGFRRWDPMVTNGERGLAVAGGPVVSKKPVAQLDQPPAWPADVLSSGGACPGRFELKRGHKSARLIDARHERGPYTGCRLGGRSRNQAQHPSQRGRPCASNGGGGYPRPCDLIILSRRPYLAHATPQFVAQCLACHPAISTPARVRSALTTNPTRRRARRGRHAHSGSWRFRAARFGQLIGSRG